MESYINNFTIDELKNIVIKFGLNYDNMLSSLNNEEDNKIILWNLIESYKVNIPIEYKYWLDLSLPFHLNVKDLLSMKEGDTMNVLFINAGFIDTSQVPGNITYKPEEFLTEKITKVKTYTYYHIKNLKGKLKLGKNWIDFDWDIEIYNDRYSSSSLYSGIDSSINLNARVGWRGPCIPSKCLYFMPEVFIN